MRDEEQAFAAESASRAHISCLWAKLEKQRMAPRRTTLENLARITAEEMAKDKKAVWGWPHSQKKSRAFKINQNYPNCWGYSS